VVTALFIKLVNLESLNKTTEKLEIEAFN
jgi:hypothetical protein